jgi:hypothetical protein
MDVAYCTIQRELQIRRELLIARTVKELGIAYLKYTEYHSIMRDELILLEILCG